LCLPSCPQEIAEVVCLDEPVFPDFVRHGEDYENFTSNYEYGSEDIVKEVREKRHCQGEIKLAFYTARFRGIRLSGRISL